MLEEILSTASGIISVYFWIATFFSGVVCVFYIAPYIKSGGFDKEAALAKFGGFAYMIGGTLLFFAAKIFL